MTNPNGPCRECAKSSRECIVTRDGHGGGSRDGGRASMATRPDIWDAENLPAVVRASMAAYPDGWNDNHVSTVVQPDGIIVVTTELDGLFVKHIF